MARLSAAAFVGARHLDAGALAGALGLPSGAAALVNALAAGEPAGSASAEDVAEAREGLGRLDAALADAEAEADGLLQGRALPDGQRALAVGRICAHHLLGRATRELTPYQMDAYTRVVDHLRRVGEGASEPLASAGGQKAVMSSAPRAFGRVASAGL